MGWWAGHEAAAAAASCFRPFLPPHYVCILMNRWMDGMET